MALPQVTPEIIGRVRSAERNVRYIAPDNSGFEKAAKGLQGFSNMAMDALGEVASLVEEKNRANFAKALADAEAEADRRMNEEVTSRTGFDAGGSLDRTRSIYSEVGDKYAAGLSRKYQDEFRTRWQSRGNASARYAMDFERRNYQKAFVDSEQRRIKTEAERYIATTDPGAFEEARSAYDSVYRANHGGRLITKESLEAFRNDYHDGDEFLTIPGRTKADGTKIPEKKLRITETETGEKDTISKARVDALLKNMEKQAEDYERGIQSLKDSMHAGVVEGLLDKDDVQGARDYLDGALTAEGMAMSDKAWEICNRAVARKAEAQQDYDSVSATMAKIRAEANTDVSRYGSREQTARYHALRNKIVEKVKDQKRAGRVLSALDFQYRAFENLQKAQLASDYIAFHKKHLQTTDPRTGGAVPLSLPEQRAKIEAMPEGPLKDLHMETLQKAEKAASSPTDPKEIMHQYQALNDFKTAVSKGGMHEVKLPNGAVATFDMGTREGVVGYAKTLGLNAENQNKAFRYYTDANKRIDVSDVSRALDSFYPKSKPGEMLEKYPYMTAFVESYYKEEPLGTGADRYRKIREAVAAGLKMEVTEDGWFWDSRVAYGKTDASKGKTIFMTKAQADDAIRDMKAAAFRRRRKFAEAQKLQNGGRQVYDRATVMKYFPGAEVDDKGNVTIHRGED